MLSPRFRHFWGQVLSLQGVITPYVQLQVLTAGAWAAVVCVAARLLETYCDIKIGMEIAPYEFAGTVLALLLGLRTNADYDRWWEARKLWGGIVNQSRNLVIAALAYGPGDQGWRERFVRWAASFPHIVRASLRGETVPPEVTELVGKDAAAEVAAASHMPSHVAWRLAELLREALDLHRMDPSAFREMERQRSLLIDHVGACERIQKTPLPTMYGVKIRQFLVVFFVLLPFALIHKLGYEWLNPVVTMMLAYPVIFLDQIGVELEGPFSTSNLNHLPLDEITAAIERNLQGALAESQRPGHPGP
jgi:putative membrane protein